MSLSNRKCALVDLLKMWRTMHSKICKWESLFNASDRNMEMWKPFKLIFKRKKYCRSNDQLCSFNLWYQLKLQLSILNFIFSLVLRLIFLLYFFLFFIFLIFLFFHFLICDFWYLKLNQLYFLNFLNLIIFEISDNNTSFVLFYFFFRFLDHLALLFFCIK